MIIKKIVLLFLFLGLILFVSCTPQEDANKVRCNSGKVFDPTSRKCVDGSTLADPTATFSGEDNSRPVGTLDYITIDEDSIPSTHSLTFTDFENDSPVTCSATESDPFNIMELKPVGVGSPTCLCIAHSCYVYIGPISNASGIAGLEYQIQDTGGGWSAAKGVIVTINAINDAPEFQVSSYNIVPSITEPFDGAAIPTLTFTATSAIDIDSTNIYYQVATEPSMGYLTNCMGKNASLTSDLLCEYTPIDGDVNGIDSFTYQACDDSLCSDIIQGNITIIAVNDTPIATTSTETLVGSEDGENSISSVVDLPLITITDPDNASLTYTVVSGPDHGIVSFSSNTMTYTINDGSVNDDNFLTKYPTWTSIDKIVYYACDADGLCSTNVTAIISLTASNDLPFIDYTAPPTDWSYNTSVDELMYIGVESSTMTATTYQVELPYMKDEEIDGGEGGSLSFSYTQLSGFSGELSEVNFSGTPYFVYTPSDGNVTGSATLFKYQAYDGNRYSKEYTVAINITPVNDEPILCEFSHFNDAVECGLNGCVGAGSPVNVIIPSKADIYYFNSDLGICYKSNSSSGWDQVNGTYIGEQIINEGDVIRITTIGVDEGSGNHVEDIESVRIQNVVSSNTNLVESENIIFYYDKVRIGDGEDTLIDLGDGVTNSASKVMVIEIIPSEGNFGSSIITFDLFDTGAIPAAIGKISFVVTVNPISAAHKGWTNIVSLGPKINNQQEVKENTNGCSYNFTGCNSGDVCTEAGDPDSFNISPDGKYVLYYDSLNGKCYYSDDDSESEGDYKWMKFNTIRFQDENSPADTHFLLCNISPTETAPECEVLGSDVKGCMGSGSPSGVITPNQKNVYYYDFKNDACYRSIGNLSSSWQEYSTTGRVELYWNSLTTYGTGAITGYNVYRRLSNTKFDYEREVNKHTITSTATYYIDNGPNSWDAPVPGTVYHYEIRPIIGGIPTDTFGNNKTVRVVAPPINKAFVHRWIANSEMCTKLHKESDVSNDYRCDYFGPGNVIVGTDRYYDLGKDLIVDRYEAGCNFSRPIGCVFDTDPENDNSCIGTIDPNGRVSASVGEIFYDRQTGMCYKRISATSTDWSDVTTLIATQPPNGHDYAELPPFSFFTQDDAHNFCGNTSVSNIMGMIPSSKSGSIPSRKEFIAMAQWNNVKSDSDISDIESGYSMNASSKCNSSQANGLSDNYTDDRVPPSAILYTLPATESFQDSNSEYVRSMYTGSKVTEGCISIFGIQDLVGNMAEWSKDIINCIHRFDTDTCIAGQATDGRYTLSVCDDDTDACELNPETNSYPSYYGTFRLNDILDGGAPFFTSPCHDLGGDNTDCEGDLTEWKIEDEYFNATKFIVPVGLPAHELFATKYAYAPTDGGLLETVDPMIEFLFSIGPSSGITTTQLHQDKFIFNVSQIGSNSAGFSNGGSYLSNVGGGLWYLETVRIGGGSGVDERSDLGFRCIYSIDPSSDYLE